MKLNFDFLIDNKIGFLMNYLGIIILAAVLVHFLANLLSEYLNLKNLNPEIPKGFEDYLDGEKYLKSQEYLKFNTKFDITSQSVDISVFLLFWFSGGFGLLDNWVRGFEYSPIVSGIFYIGLLSFGKGVIDIPFSMYKTFVIEEKFGFNKTTLKLYISDKIKITLISALIGIPMIAGVLYFFEYAGEFAWVFCWIAFSLFMLAMQIIVPIWIMPLFNKFTSLEDGELRDAVMSYAKSNDFPLENVYVMDGSRRSGKSNAFFSGFGKTKRLVLFDTIMENHSIDEIISIIAHETGHYKKKHILMSSLLGIFQSGIMFYLLSLFITHKDLFSAFYVNEISVYAGIVFFGMLYSPVAFFVEIVMLMISRRNEFQADEFAVNTIEKRESLVKTLKKLSSDNYSNLTPHPMNVVLSYSHPPIIERIKRINEV